MESTDVLIVGAGVTGLATARALAARGLSTVVLERHARPGLDTSTHNSGVIHAGIYYPPGTLKARLCVEGRHLLYAFCRTHGVPHRRCGKLIVATNDAEIPELARLRARGMANGVETLEMVDRAFAAGIEPAIQCVAALHAPDTGIVDAASLVLALLRDAQDKGAVFLAGTQLLGADRTPDGVAVRTRQETILARHVVNAAGLYADDVSTMLGGESFTIYPVRGEYAELAPSRRTLVRGLVYPVPDRHALGIHFVKTVDGAVWLGPTVRHQSGKDDYETDRLPLDAFVEPAQKLLPDVGLADLRLSGSGIRPRLHSPSETFADFLIRRDHQNPRVVHAAGIESPGLTACLAVGQMVADIVTERT